MGFEKFGVVIAATEGRASKFVDYLEQGKITATRCPKCGKEYFPPHTECSKCLTTGMDWFELAPDCTLNSFTIVRYGPTGFENKAPYTIGVVEFANGFRMLGLLSQDIPHSDIKVGMKLKAVVVKLEGNRISYEFRQ